MIFDLSPPHLLMSLVLLNIPLLISTALFYTFKRRAREKVTINPNLWGFLGSSVFYLTYIAASIIIYELFSIFILVSKDFFSIFINFSPLLGLACASLVASIMINPKEKVRVVSKN